MEDDERMNRLIDIVIKQNREHTDLLDEITLLKEEIADLKANLAAWQAAATGG